MKLKLPLILASNSPRRQQMLRDLGLDFTIKVPDIDESFPNNMEIQMIPEYLARKKAESFNHTENDQIIVTADTIVVLDGKILNKPANTEEAMSMLSGLAGKSHYVYTGVCLLFNREFHTITEKTEVVFDTLSTEEIDYYIKHYMPLDKAGAYGIQEWIGMVGIKKISGSYFNVVGLPVQQLFRLFKDLDLLEF